MKHNSVWLPNYNVGKENNFEQKSNPDEWEIGLERVVDSKFDKGLEEVIL